MNQYPSECRPDQTIFDLDGRLALEATVNQLDDEVTSLKKALVETESERDSLRSRLETIQNDLRQLEQYDLEFCHPIDEDSVCAAGLRPDRYGEWVKWRDVRKAAEL